MMRDAEPPVMQWFCHEEFLVKCNLRLLTKQTESRKQRHIQHGAHLRRVRFNTWNTQNRRKQKHGWPISRVRTFVSVCGLKPTAAVGAGSGQVILRHSCTALFTWEWDACWGWSSLPRKRHRQTCLHGYRRLRCRHRRSSLVPTPLPLALTTSTGCSSYPLQSSSRNA